ncbi:MAG: hypothetical protein J7L07_00790 [Candidatus Odinarchaeota archaeon]|nr:hypothetical protein [Candidatus Odinarchaeota archaeon]
MKVKVALLSAIILILLIAPLAINSWLFTSIKTPSDSLFQGSVEKEEDHATPSIHTSQDEFENLTAIKIKYPYSYAFSYTTLGNFKDGAGLEIAGIKSEYGYVCFFDIATKTIFAINNDTKGDRFINGIAIATANLDSDDYDEVFYMNVSGYIFLIDNNATTLKMLKLQLSDKIGEVYRLIITDLNLDNYDDIVVYGRTYSEDFVAAINGASQSFLFNFTMSQYAIRGVTVGNFDNSLGLEVAIAYSNNTVTIYTPSLSLIRRANVLESIYSLYTISNSSWHYDALILLCLDVAGSIKIYNATTLTNMGYQANIGSCAPEIAVTGDFDADSSTEIAITTWTTGEAGLVIFDLNTNNITKAMILFNVPIIAINSGKITADDTDDLVVSSSEESYVFKGVRGQKANIAFLRKIDEPTYIHKVSIAQYDTGLMDVFIHTTKYLYIYRSDSKPPRVYDVRTYPIRPTVEDSFFYVSALVMDESEFSDPLLTYNFTSLDGTLIYTNMKKTMAPESHASNTYLAYFFDLSPGVYTFKIKVVDSYDNIAVFDNNGSMYSVTIYSKRIFKHKLQNDFIRSAHPIDVGEIDGQSFSEVAVALDENITIVWGNNSISAPITYANADYAQVYLEDIDGVSGDDIILYCYNTSISAYQIRVFSGSAFSLILKRTYSSEISKFAFGDIDSDGINEIILVENINSTTNRLIAIDTSTNTTIIEYYVPQVFCLGVYNVTLDSYMDIAILTVGQNGLSFNLTVFAGENNLKQLYSYNSSVDYAIYEAYLFMDTFVTSDYAQFVIAIGAGTGLVYIINATNGVYISGSTLTYLTGLAVVDCNYDSLKELSFLLYDNTLMVVDIARNMTLLTKKTLLPSSPLAVFWTNFDEDSYEDLVYVLPDSIAIYSLINDRYEIVPFPFRVIVASAVGDFFELPSNDICILSEDSVLEKYININMFYRANVSVTISSSTVVQGGSIDVKVYVENVFNDPITESDITAFLIFNDTILQSSSFTSHKNGSYTLTLSAVNIPIGNYTLVTIVNDAYYGIYLNSYNITVKGEIEAVISVPETVIRGGPLLVNVTLIDQYGFPVINANVTASIEGEIHHPVEVVRNMYLFLINTENLTVGSRDIIIMANHSFAIMQLQIPSSINIIGIPHIEIKGRGITESPVIQGDSFSVRLTLYDNYQTPVAGGRITAYFFGRPYTFTDIGNGTYIVTISTQDIPGGNHSLLIEVTHDFLEKSFFSANVTIIGVPNINLQISPAIIVQQSIMNVTITATDIFGYPISGANVIVSFAGRNFVAENIHDNVYIAMINVGNVHHGEYEISVRFTAAYHQEIEVSEYIFVYPQIPKLDLSPRALMLLLGISIGASFVGLIIYYNISSRLVRSFSVDEQGKLIMSFKPLDTLYYFFTALLFITIIAAANLYRMRLYEASVAALGLALVEILLVHGIWLYRDTAYTLINEKLPIIRTLIGLWHLILAPIIIFGIFIWGINIEWFSFYLLKDVINIGGLILPSLYVSLMGTYVTSIIVLTINIYLNSRSLKNRFSEMRAGGTPEKVINEEKVIQLDKMSGSIRIKFFVFLAILGASIVTTATPLLQYYQLGVVVILPLIFIVVVPYVISKVLKALGFARRVIKKITVVSQSQSQ